MGPLPLALSFNVVLREKKLTKVKKITSWLSKNANFENSNFVVSKSFVKRKIQWYKIDITNILGIG